MKKYRIKIEHRDGRITDESFETENEQMERFSALTHSQKAGEEIAHIEGFEVPDIEVDKSMPHGLAFVASVITCEFYRTIMIKTLLTREEVSKLIARVASDCYLKIEDLSSEVIIEQAKKELFANHNIKVS